MNKLTNTTLKDILKNHTLWLSEKGGYKANLRDADLQCADLLGVNLEGANLEGADLRKADLQDVNLQGADLVKADLIRADLRMANLKGADLRGADLRETNLRKANLEGANLLEVNIQGADLKGANLRGTVFEDGVPTMIQTEFYTIIKHKDSVQIGCKMHTKEEWKNFSDEEISEMDPKALDFWKKYKNLVLN